MNWGGHNLTKIYNAYLESSDSPVPTIILAQTIKGHGMKGISEAMNISHKVTTLSNEDLEKVAKEWDIPLKIKDIHNCKFYRPTDKSVEGKYIRERRQVLNGYVPSRTPANEFIEIPKIETVGLMIPSKTKASSTTLAFVKYLRKLMKSTLGDRIVPIVADEARTFGLETLFTQFKIYNPKGQLYTPVDQGTLIEYKESDEGQILEEGISEAGSMAAFIASGTSGNSVQKTTIPFYIFYSMFGPQRVGDLIWAAADACTKGFLLGATAGRTTLNGEGLQHQDGQSQLYAQAVPNLLSYDPAFSSELVTIIEDGLKRMFVDKEDIFYYITLYNENYMHLELPRGAREGVLKGMYLLESSAQAQAQILASGSSVKQALEAKKILKNNYDIEVNIWSVTSFNLLYRDAQQITKRNNLFPFVEKQKSYLEKQLENFPGPYIGISDFASSYPGQISPWIPGTYTILGTDGFGRSDSRENLRKYFEVSEDYIVWSVLCELYKTNKIKEDQLQSAGKELKIKVSIQDQLSL